MPSNLEDAEIEWMGNAKQVLSSWPVAIKTSLGFELRKVQRGEMPSDSKLLPGIGGASESFVRRMLIYGTE